MKRFLLNLALYAFLIVLVLESMVRIFHLHRDTPERYIDKQGVEKWVPGQRGFSVTGNRKQNFSEYHINNQGYNSYRDFNTVSDETIVALIGDSFIEGFHQDYYNSIGKKMEKSMPGVSVYEYGYAGYDMADQLHLIAAYEEDFRKIDKVVIYLKYPEDLSRDQHNAVQDRMRLNKGIYPYLKISKLLVYSQNIGLIGSLSSTILQLKNAIFSKSDNENRGESEIDNGSENERLLHNFIRLSDNYEYDKNKFLLLLDSRECPKTFLEFLEDEQFVYIDYGIVLEQSTTPVTLIYDQHWNDHGRTLVSEIIVETLKGEAARLAK
jgi:hypothetical protein